MLRTGAEGNLSAFGCHQRRFGAGFKRSLEGMQLCILSIIYSILPSAFCSGLPPLSGMVSVLLVVVSSVGFGVVVLLALLALAAVIFSVIFFAASSL